MNAREKREWILKAADCLLCAEPALKCGLRQIDIAYAIAVLGTRLKLITRTRKPTQQSPLSGIEILEWAKAGGVKNVI